MATQQISRIGVLSLAKIMGVLYAFLGLVIGGFISLFAILGAGFAARQNEGSPLGFLFGVAAIVVAPIFYGCLGFIGGLVTAPIYNLAAKLAGGIEVDLE